LLIKFRFIYKNEWNAQNKEVKKRIAILRKETCVTNQSKMVQQGNGREETAGKKLKGNMARRRKTSD
jgi:hypothetical protein